MALIASGFERAEESAAVPIAHDYEKGKAINLGSALLNAGSSTSADLVTAGYLYLTVMFRLGNGTTPATAATDCNGGVTPYEDDGLSILAPGFMTTQLGLHGAALSNPYSYLWQIYLLGGIDKVRVTITNNNAGALQGATAVYYLQK